MKVMIVMPTYNEAENLPKVVKEIFSLGIAGLEILVVDDNSPDGTGTTAESLALKHPGRLHVLHRPVKLGLGRAYVAGFQHALDKGPDYIIQMDADLSHSPAYIPLLLEKMCDYDVVVGSRYVPGGKIDSGWSLWRRFLSWWGGCVYAPLILGLRVHDATTGFKCFRRQVLEEIDLRCMRSDGYVFLVEMAYVYQRMGYRVLEIPIVFEDRVLGKSKMSLRVALEAAWRVWEIRWRYRKLCPLAKGRELISS